MSDIKILTSSSTCIFLFSYKRLCVYANLFEKGIYSIRDARDDISKSRPFKELKIPGHNNKAVYMYLLMFVHSLITKIQNWQLSYTYL